MARFLSFLFAFIAATGICSHAASVDFAGITFEVPDSLKDVSPDGYNNVRSFASCNGMIYITTYGDPEISDHVDFDPKVVFQKLHSITFNLTGQKLLKTEKHDDGLMYNHHYVRNTYDTSSSKNAGNFFTTHTFHTSKRPYVIAVEYNSTEIPAEFADIITSIDTNESFWTSQWICVKNYWAIIFLLMTLAMIVSNLIGCFFDRDSHAIHIGIGVTIVIIGGFLLMCPECILLTGIAIIPVFLLSWLSASISFGDMVAGIINELS